MNKKNISIRKCDGQKPTVLALQLLADSDISAYTLTSLPTDRRQALLNAVAAYDITTRLPLKLRSEPVAAQVPRWSLDETKLDQFIHEKCPRTRLYEKPQQELLKKRLLKVNWQQMGHDLEPLIRDHLYLSPDISVSIIIFGSILNRFEGQPGDIDIFVVIEDPSFLKISVGTDKLELADEQMIKRWFEKDPTLLPRESSIDISYGGIRVLSSNPQNTDVTNAIAFTYYNGLVLKGRHFVETPPPALLLIQESLMGAGNIHKHLNAYEEKGKRYVFEKTCSFFERWIAQLDYVTNQEHFPRVFKEELYTSAKALLNRLKKTIHPASSEPEATIDTISAKLHEIEKIFFQLERKALSFIKAQRLCELQGRFHHAARIQTCEYEMAEIARLTGPMLLEYSESHVFSSLPSWLNFLELLGSTSEDDLAFFTKFTPAPDAYLPSFHSTNCTGHTAQLISLLPSEIRPNALRVMKLEGPLYTHSAVIIPCSDGVVLLEHDSYYGSQPVSIKKGETSAWFTNGGYESGPERYHLSSDGLVLTLEERNELTHEPHFSTYDLRYRLEDQSFASKWFMTLLPTLFIRTKTKDGAVKAIIKLNLKNETLSLQLGNSKTDSIVIPFRCIKSDETTIQIDIPDSRQVTVQTDRPFESAEGPMRYFSKGFFEAIQMTPKEVWSQIIQIIHNRDRIWKIMQSINPMA